MLVAKTESGKACPTSAVSASATVIETSDSRTGISPATTEPKTINRTIRRPATRNPSSPFSRSSSARVDSSASTVNSPVIVTSNLAAVGVPHRFDDAVDPVLGVAAEGEEDHRRVAFARDECDSPVS